MALDWISRLRSLSRQTKLLLLWVSAAVSAGAVLLLPRIPQWQSYHDFADKRALGPIPNAGDVLSNIAFLAVGAVGLAWLAARSGRRNSALPPAQAEARAELDRVTWGAFAAAFSLTAFGSAWYHLAPNDQRLVFDRLPMTIVAAGAMAGVASDQLGHRAGRLILFLYGAAGIASVLYWTNTQQAGVGDLRPYGWTQAYPALGIASLLALFPHRFSHAADLLRGGACYGVAKLCEALDKPIYAVGHIVSGHTLKHLFAAAAGLYILHMLQRRDVLRGPSPQISVVASSG